MKAVAYAKIKSLVNQFKSLSPAERKDYNEAATCQVFILPMFEALGWQIHNLAEVSPEEKVSRGFVDFAFRLNYVPRFLLEAKRLFEDIAKIEWARQVIDYAWTKDVVWAVLSNFQETIVFNAEWKEDNPLRAQFIRFNIDTYLSDFDRLWWLSRPETQAGRLDREAEQVGKKSLKEPVSQELFNDLKEWRRTLARHLSGYNQDYAPAQIDQAVLRILNRLIFIRTAEDRQAEPLRLLPLLRDLLQRNRLAQLYGELTRLFREFDATYNSDLFAEHFSETLVCDPEPFRILIEGLHEKPGGCVRYNFNAIDTDVLGAVYEQYLGAPLHTPRASEVSKRKAQGIYYTPTFIVRYIVQQTLGQHLQEHGYDAARPVRVLDMACGSGSFLIEAFDVLDRHMGNTQVHASEQADHARRTEILTQCLYGVDKDEQAIAVTKLNLSLKALHSRHTLPMLANIRTGDSLISGPPDELKKAFGKKWEAKHPFDWDTEFSSVMQSGGFDVIVGNPPYIRAENMPRTERDYYMRSANFTVAYGRFDIHILFIEQALKHLRSGGRLGFIVPYSVLHQNYGEKLRQCILDHCAIERIVDLSHYRVFQDAAVDTCILILRREDQPQTRQNHNIGVVTQSDYAEGITAKPAFIPQSAFCQTPGNMFRLELRGPDLALVAKIDSASLKLSELCYCVIGAVPHESETGRSKDALIFDAPKRKSCQPYVEGKELERYRLSWQGRYLAYQPAKMHRPKFPELFENPKIIVRNISGAEGIIATYDAQKFYANDTVSLCVKWERLDGVKARLNVKRPPIPPHAIAYDLRYVLGVVNSKLSNYYFWICLGGGLHVYPDLIRQLPIHRINFDDPAEKHQHDAIVALVGELLQLRQDHTQAERALQDSRHALQRRIDEIDAEIDQRVYALYGLTPEEISLVENK